MMVLFIQDMGSLDKYDFIDSRATLDGHFRDDGSEKTPRSQEGARRRAKALRQKGTKNARHYFCDVCEMFHVGRYNQNG